MVDISLIVPVYKEEANIRSFLARAEKVFENMGKRYEIIFSLDPSPDRTEDVILARNWGRKSLLSHKKVRPGATGALQIPPLEPVLKPDRPRILRALARSRVVAGGVQQCAFLPRCAPGDRQRVEGESPLR